MEATAIARPVRANVAALYDRGVEAYVSLWSAVILPAAQTVVTAMGLDAADTVVDVGAGSGAVVPSIRAASPRGKVIAVDASTEMLRVARDRTDALVARSDALALPLRDGCADAVLLAFVLFHLRDPGAALHEAARVLRAGGTVGTATWARSSEISPRAYEVWDTTLTEMGAPAVPGGRIDTGLDSIDAIESLLRDGGFTPSRAWIEPLRHQWTPDTYFGLATGSGMNRLRLEVLDQRTRIEALDRAHARISALEPADLLWTGDVVSAVAALRC